MARNDVLERLAAVQRRAGHIEPERFRTEGSVSSNTPGERSRIAAFEAPTVHAIRPGRSNRFDIGIPAYEQFSTDGSDGNSETFGLAHDLKSTPNAADVVVYLDGSYYGEPDATDYAANTIDVTDPGSNSNLHVWYYASEAATLEIVKTNPSGATSEELYSENLKLVHQTPHAEQPEYFQLGQSQLQPFVPTDWTLGVYVDAPYQVRFTDPAGDGAQPTNLLLDIPAHAGEDSVQGLGALVAQDAASR